MNRKILGMFALLAAGLACGALMMNVPDQAAAEDDRSKLSPSWQSAKPVEQSVHEYMEYVHEPTFHRLKDAMAEAPAGGRQWSAITSNALILAESANLLLLRGPELDRQTWIKDATAVRAAGAALYRAAHDKDFETARKKYELMVANCNQCHKDFAHGEHQLTP